MAGSAQTAPELSNTFNRDTMQKNLDALKGDFYAKNPNAAESFYSGKYDQKRFGKNASASNFAKQIEQMQKNIAAEDRRIAAMGGPTPGGTAGGSGQPVGGPATGGGLTGPPGGAGGAGGGGLSNVPNFFNDTSRPPAPGMTGFDYKGGPGEDYLKKIFELGTTGSTDAYNNAANRLRERTDAATMGNVGRAQNANLSRGFGVSGINDAAVQKQQGLGANAYAQGLSDLELGMEDRRQQGLQTALGAAGQQLTDERGRNQMSLDDLLNNRNLTNSNWQFGQTLDQQQRQSLMDFLSGREARASNEGIAASGNRSNEGIAAAGNASNNWNNALNVGANKTPDLVNVPSMGGNVTGAGSAGKGGFQNFGNVLYGLSGGLGSLSR